MVCGSVENCKANFDAIKESLGLYCEPGKPYELRVIKAGKYGTISGYYTDEVRMAEDALFLTEEGHGGIYTTLNPTVTSVVARKYNDFGRYVKNTTTDAEIQRRCRFLVDTDPVRPTNTSASEAEVAAALEFSGKVVEWMVSQGWPEPVRAHSGNGGHAVWKIDLPNDDESRLLIERALKALDVRFSNDSIKVDTSVFNAARIVKIPGTWSRKGDDFAGVPDLGIEARPHRLSHLLSRPADLQIVPLDLLGELADQWQPVATKVAVKPSPTASSTASPSPSSSSSERNPKGSWTAERLEKWLDGHGLEHYPREIDHTGRSKFVLHHCPFNESHAGKDAALFLTDGHPGFKCFHDSCGDKSWTDVRALFDGDEEGVFRAQENRVDGLVEPIELTSLEPIEAPRVPTKVTYRAREIRPHHNTLIDATNYMDTAGKILEDLWDTGGEITLRHRRKNWYVWEGTRYLEILEEVVRKKLWSWLAGAVVKKKEGEVWVEVAFKPDSRFVGYTFDALRSLCQMESDEVPQYLGDKEYTERPGRIISVQNGMLDLDAYLDGKTCMAPSSPLWFNTSVLGFGFEPSAECPRWIEFLHDIFEDDQDRIDTLQQWFGYNLTADTSQQTAMMFVGSGRNGKGTVSRRLQSILGESACASSFKAIGGQFGCHPLLGRTAVIFPDAHLGKTADPTLVAEVLKSIIGEDHVTIDRKNRDAYSCKLNTKVTILTNSLPYLPDVSAAIGKRFIFLPFHRNYAGMEDRNLDDKLAKEDPGILRWALDGLKSLKAQGRFRQPEAGASLRRDFDQNGSPIQAFIDDYCVIDQAVFEYKDMLRSCMNNYLLDNGHKPLSTEAVTVKLRAVNTRIESDRPTIEGKRVQVYRGIALKDSAKALLGYHRDPKFVGDCLTA